MPATLGLKIDAFAVWSRPKTRRASLLLGEDPGPEGTEGTPQAQTKASPGAATYSDGFAGGEPLVMSRESIGVPDGQGLSNKGI